jgi:hypothetical protein
MVQYFDDSSNPEAAPDVSGWNITVTLGDGNTEKVTLPAGGGAGPDCNID